MQTPQVALAQRAAWLRLRGWLRDELSQRLEVAPLRVAPHGEHGWLGGGNLAISLAIRLAIGLAISLVNWLELVSIVRLSRLLHRQSRACTTCVGCDLFIGSHRHHTPALHRRRPFYQLSTAYRSVQPNHCHRAPRSCSAERPATPLCVCSSSATMHLT